MGRRCLASDCETDLECEPGFACRVLSDDPLLRLCVLAGTRLEGEHCELFPVTRDESCEGGLRCVHGFCGRACALGVPTSCAEGFACVDNPREGPTCVPSCLHTGCPNGQRCFRIEGEHAVCGLLRGDDCEKTPCAPGEQCVSSVWGPTEYVWMRCVQPCDEDTPCPRSSLCLYGLCQRPCDPEGPNICGPTERCLRYPEDNMYLCTESD
jgi:hypothetical protein